MWLHDLRTPTPRLPLPRGPSARLGSRPRRIRPSTRFHSGRARPTPFLTGLSPRLLPSPVRDWTHASSLAPRGPSLRTSPTPEGGKPPSLSPFTPRYMLHSPNHVARRDPPLSSLLRVPCPSLPRPRLHTHTRTQHNTPAQTCVHTLLAYSHPLPLLPQAPSPPSKLNVGDIPQ